MNPSLARNAVPAQQSAEVRQRPTQPALDLLQRFGGYVAMVYVLMVYVRLAEYIPFRAHLPLIMTLVLLLCTVFTNGIPRAFNSKAAMLLSALAGWFIVSIPFSFWRYGSLMLLTNYYSFAFLSFVGVTALIVTLQQLRKLTWLIAAGAWVLALLALFYGSESLGRSGISAEVSGSLTNPNDVALYLIFGLPFSVLVVLDPARSRLMRLLALAASMVTVYATLRTGSRMGLLGLLVLAVSLLLRGSMKLAVFGAGFLLAVLALVSAVLPEGAMVRYRAMLHSDVEVFAEAQKNEDPNAAADQLEKARDSAASRKALILSGILLTLRHPLFGVGPGQFGNAMAQDGNRPLAWVQPHNTYTQLSSELGIPGFVLFVWVVIHSMRASYRIYRTNKGRRDLVWVSRLGYCLFTCFVAFAVMGMFAHQAYSFMVPLLCGLTVVLERVGGYESARSPSAVPYTPAPRPPAAGVAVGRGNAQR